MNLYKYEIEIKIIDVRNREELIEKRRKFNTVLKKEKTKACQ